MARYGTISGSSAAAAVTAGAAALSLRRARTSMPPVSAVRSSRRRGAVPAASIPGWLTRQARRRSNSWPTRRRCRLVRSRRPGRTRGAGHATERHAPRADRRSAARCVGCGSYRRRAPRARRAPAGRRQGRHAHAQGDRAPSGAECALGRDPGRRRAGVRLRIPWTAAVPVTDRPVLSRVALSSDAFVRERPVEPAVLPSSRAGSTARAERPQLPPLVRARDRPLSRRAPGRHARAATRRLPGRYALRPHRTRPNGGRLPSGRSTSSGSSRTPVSGAARRRERALPPPVDGARVGASCEPRGAADERAPRRRPTFGRTLRRSRRRSCAASARRSASTPNLIGVLSQCKKTVEVSIPVSMDDSTVQVFEGYRIIHNMTRGPAKGGMRYHPASRATRSRRWRCG